MSATATIPVFVIGGYLGAGKTTLLNALLRDAQGVRYAVLVNDFGSVNIDAALIAASGQQTIELTNGCTCCTIGGDLILALKELVARDVAPDRIVIEASGVANPAAVARLAGAHPALRVRGTIVVADAETIQERAGDRFVGGVVRRQLDAADRIVLSKMDLAGDDRRAAVRDWLTQRNPAVPIIESVSGARLSAEQLFAIAGDDDPSHGSAEEAAEDHAFRSSVFESDVPLHRARFERAVRAMIPAIARAKGIVRFSETPDDRHVFQLAGERWSIVPCAAAESAAATRVVLIATAENAAILEIAVARLRDAKTCRPSFGRSDAGRTAFPPSAS